MAWRLNSREVLPIKDQWAQFCMLSTSLHPYPVSSSLSHLNHCPKNEGPGKNAQLHISPLHTHNEQNK